MGVSILCFSPGDVGHFPEHLQHLFHAIVHGCVSPSDLCLGRVHHVRQPGFACRFIGMAHQPRTHRTSELSFLLQFERRGASLQRPFGVRASAGVGQSDTCAGVGQGLFFAVERVDGPFQGRGRVSASRTGHGDLVFVRHSLPSLPFRVSHVHLPLARLSHRRHAFLVPTHVARGPTRSIPPWIPAHRRHEVRASIHQHHRGFGRFPARGARHRGHGVRHASARLSTGAGGRHASLQLRHCIHQSACIASGRVYVPFRLSFRVLPRRRTPRRARTRHDHVHVFVHVFFHGAADGVAQGSLPILPDRVLDPSMRHVCDLERKMEGFRSRSGGGAHVHGPMDHVQAGRGRVHVVEGVAPGVHKASKGRVGVFFEARARTGGVGVLGEGAEHAHVLGALGPPPSHGFHRLVQDARPQQQDVPVAHHGLHPRPFDVVHAHASRSDGVQVRFGRRHGLAGARVHGHHASVEPFGRRHGRLHRPLHPARHPPRPASIRTRAWRWRKCASSLHRVEDGTTNCDNGKCTKKKGEQKGKPSQGEGGGRA
eukprot:scaffold64_cov338-Pavlova_lutheri.AAC.2